jgi:putative addiction module component (TIGR02574 family)
MSDLAEILERALKLPESARAALAGSLIDSLEDEVDEDAEQAWNAEIARRLAELNSGSTTTVPWSQARRRIFGG